MSKHRDGWRDGGVKEQEKHTEEVSQKLEGLTVDVTKPARLETQYKVGIKKVFMGLKRESLLASVQVNRWTFGRRLIFHPFLISPT